jgi:hypothetical protein
MLRITPMSPMRKGYYEGRRRIGMDCWWLSRRCSIPVFGLDVGAAGCSARADIRSTVSGYGRDPVAEDQVPVAEDSPTS